MPPKRNNKPKSRRLRRVNPTNAMYQPLARPIVSVKRSCENTYNIVCDGINPSIGNINFSLNDLPNSAEFTSLFQMYKIANVKLTWRPEYTVLSDASALSNSVNVGLTTAYDPNGNSVASVDDVLQLSSAKTTSISKEHRRTVKPLIFMGAVSPCSCFVSTNSSSTNWYSLSFAVPPTGVAMTFRSSAIFTIQLSGTR